MAATIFTAMFLLLADMVYGAGFSVSEFPDRVEVTEDEIPVFTYNIKNPFPGRYKSRAHYFHPVYDLQGDVISVDFPLDHRHHHGIFWAWSRIVIDGKEIADSWHCQGFTWLVSNVVTTIEKDSVKITMKVLWQSENYRDEQGIPIAIMEENTTVTVHSRDEVGRKIDFDIAIKPLISGVSIGGSNDHKGYGGFSWRFKLPSDLAFADEAGGVLPKSGPVRRSRWMTTTGTFNAGLTSVSVLTHPGSSGFPQPWILRKQRAMQNAVFPGSSLHALVLGEPVLLKHRMILHSGSVADEMEGLWKRYVGKYD